MAEHEGPDAGARCQRQRRRQPQGAGPDFDEHPRPPTRAWVRSPHGTRQRKPRRDEPARHVGPPAPCASCTLGEEAARKRWHVRIGTAGARVVRVRNAQASGASDTNGVRTMVCAVPRGHGIGSAGSRARTRHRRPFDALRIPRPSAEAVKQAHTKAPTCRRRLRTPGPLETIFPLGGPMRAGSPPRHAPWPRRRSRRHSASRPRALCRPAASGTRSSTRTG